MGIFGILRYEYTRFEDDLKEKPHVVKNCNYFAISQLAGTKQVQV